MAKEKELRRLTMYVDPEDPTKFARVEIDGVARLVDDGTGDPDEDLGDWINKAKNFAEGENPGATIINMVKTRFGI